MQLVRELKVKINPNNSKVKIKQVKGDSKVILRYSGSDIVKYVF